MKIHKEKIELQTTTQIEFIDVTKKVEEVVEKSGIRERQVLICTTHTTSGIVINHNESMLIQDFMRTLYRSICAKHPY